MGAGFGLSGGIAIHIPKGLIADRHMTRVVLGHKKGFFHTVEYAHQEGCIGA